MISLRLRDGPDFQSPFITQLNVAPPLSSSSNYSWNQPISHLQTLKSEETNIQRQENTTAISASL